MNRRVFLNFLDCRNRGAEKTSIKKNHDFIFIQFVCRCYSYATLNAKKRCSVPNKNTRNSHFYSRFLKCADRVWSLYLIIMISGFQVTAEKCTKMYNARAQRMFFSCFVLFVVCFVANLFIFLCLFVFVCSFVCLFVCLMHFVSFAYLWQIIVLRETVCGLSRFTNSYPNCLLKSLTWF